MNPLTLVKRTQQINEQEAKLGISEQASWHAKYSDSAYVFVGGVPFDLTEGDLIAVFAQYGEIVDVNLVRDKATGKSKGFAFVAYEDQRSTNLAVDNLNGAQVLGRTIRVDHCSKYKKKEEEDEETARQKREERGVCRAFQKGECTRGDSCKFSHDEKRAANTGWGAEEDKPRWANDKFDSTQRNGHSRQTNPIMKDDRLGNNDMRGSNGKDDGLGRDGHQKGSEWKSRDQGSRDFEKRSEKEWKSRDQGSRDFEKQSEKDKGRNYKGEMDRSHADRKSRRPDDEQMPREDRHLRDIEKRSEKDKGRNYKEEMDRSHADRKSRQPDDEHMSREDRDKRGEKRVRSESLRREDQERMRRPGYERDLSPHHQKMSDSEQREDRPKRDEKRTRFGSDSYKGEGRESGRSDKRSDYGRDSSPLHRRADEEDRGHRSHR